MINIYRYTTCRQLSFFRTCWYSKASISQKRIKKGTNTDDRYLQKLLKLKLNNEKYVRDDHWIEYEKRTKNDKFKGYKKELHDYRPSNYEPKTNQKDMNSDDINRAIVLEQALFYSRFEDKNILIDDDDIATSYLEQFHNTNYNKIWKTQIQSRQKHRKLVRIIMARLFVADSYAQHNAFRFNRDTVVDYVWHIVNEVIDCTASYRDRYKKEYQREKIIQTIHQARYYFNNKYCGDTRGNGMHNKEKTNSITRQ